MPTFEFIALISVFPVVWFWLDSIQAREAAVRAAASACLEEDLQFLDETVVLRRLRLGRDDAGRLRVVREYGFEFSETGDNRQEGCISLLGQEVERLRLLPHRLELVVNVAEGDGET